MDILSDELARARAQGAVFSVLRRVAPWGLQFSGTRPLTAHILLHGDGWIEADGADPVPLHGGDVVLAGAGGPYSIVSEPGAVSVPIAEARQATSTGPTTVVCGAYVLSGSVADTLLDSLPRFAVVRVAEQEPAHAAAIELLAAEAARDSEGQQALLDRLLDVNLVYALRSWWQHAGNPAPGWFRALSRPAVRRVLESLHAHPEQDWSLVTMAQLAGMSRAAFAAEFTRVIGQSPGRYLTELRMRRAEDALLRTDATLAQIAGSVGYRNEFAFATAFRRHRSVSPGRWRRVRTSGRPAGRR
ncbi:AraC family transcriptional regulator [Winogradskya humida]|uniref:AraC family transcriptional regulator n=1 Tax=Winogradskya humida TaxID=113566 RepID=UPI0019435230|nr:AraC family transcriptional regulator [Actinoplanes humidus]